MARLGAPHGIKGWMRLHIFSHHSKFLSDGMLLWCRPEKQQWRLLKLVAYRTQASNCFVQMESIDNRTTALQWVHSEIAVNFSALPALEEDRFYWHDLIGLRVINVLFEELGVVTDLIATGANDVFCVAPKSGKEILIPFVATYVLSISLEEQTITVNWDRDW